MKTVVRVLWGVLLAVAFAGCGKVERAQDEQASSAAVAAASSGAAPQFLTLPMHPRVLAGADEEGIGELDGRFVWNAPFVNGQPPGQTRGNGSQAAISVDAAPISTLALAALPPNVDVSNAVGSYQGETTGGSNGTVVVGGSNNIVPGACATNVCAVAAYTSTSGTSWTTTVQSPTWNGTTFGITFDPGIDVDTAGNFYYVFGGAPLSGSFPNSIAVARSGPDGLSWGTPVAVTFNARRAFDDKYYLAIDRSAGAFANSIYVGWDRNIQNNQILFVAFSRDRGATWSAPVKVDDGTTKFERVIGAYPAVDQATGTVYMSWHNYARDIIFVDRSTSGGQSWGTDVAAATTHTGFGVDIGCNGGRSQSPAHALKVDSAGTLHLVYADQVAGRGFDILYVRSTNGGASWSAPVRLNDDLGAAHQYHPTLSVDGATITVTFYDRRDDLANCQSHVYATQSTDGGATWSANVRLSTDPSSFDGNPNGPGDYSSSTPHGLNVFPFHSDHRTTDADSLMEIYTYPL
ncbi:MAG TPA: sialidase family protein [Anaeromyxobacter sp.]